MSDQSNKPAQTKKMPVSEQLSSEEWLIQFTQAIVEEIYGLTDEQGATYGPEFARLARLSIVTSLVTTLVYSALLSVPKNSKNLRAAVDTHHLAYKEVKEAITNAVCAGFEGATRTWSGKPVEYYCSVEIVPEPFSGTLN